MFAHKADAMNERIGKTTGYYDVGFSEKNWPINRT
jgi:hypothetical protein